LNLKYKVITSEMDKMARKFVTVTFSVASPKIFAVKAGMQTISGTDLC